MIQVQRHGEGPTRQMFGPLLLAVDLLGMASERLDSVPIPLHDGDGDLTGLARVNVAYRSGLSGVRPADDGTLRAIRQSCWIRCRHRGLVVGGQHDNSSGAPIKILPPHPRANRDAAALGMSTRSCIRMVISDDLWHPVDHVGVTNLSRWGEVSPKREQDPPSVTNRRYATWSG